ncbi:MAG: S24 family peptidase, partial [Pseudomonadota bacterium]
MHPAIQNRNEPFDLSLCDSTQSYRLENFPYRHKNIINDRVGSLVMPDNSMIDSGIKQEDVLIVEPNKKPQDGMIVAALISGTLLIRRYFKIKNKICLTPDNVEIASTET